MDRTVAVTVGGAGPTTLTLSVPLELQLPEGGEGAQVRVQVRVQTRGAKQASLGEITSATRNEPVEELSPEPPEKKGLFGRLFGR